MFFAAQPDGNSRSKAPRAASSSSNIAAASRASSNAYPSLSPSNGSQSHPAKSLPLTDHGLSEDKGAAGRERRRGEGKGREKQKAEAAAHVHVRPGRRAFCVPPFGSHTKHTQARTHTGCRLLLLCCCVALLVLYCCCPLPRGASQWRRSAHHHHPPPSLTRATCSTTPNWASRAVDLSIALPDTAKGPRQSQ